MNDSLSLEIFERIPVPMFITNKDKQILFVSDKMLSVVGHQSLLQYENATDFFNAVAMNSDLENFLDYDTEEIMSCTINEKKYLIEHIEDQKYNYFFFHIESQLNRLFKHTNLFRNLDQDLKAIFENTYDVIYVTDGSGKTLRASSASERLWGYKSEELIGKNAYELEKNGVFKPSVTRLVLEQGKQVQALQTTRTGRRLLVVGTPIKNDQGVITRVINTSRDITDVDQLQSELEITKGMLKGYVEELKVLRLRQDDSQMQIISRSPKMRCVISLAKKVSTVYSTVLILGDSGVGKEMIARYIHEQSEDAIEPFVTVNCSSLPKNLLEIELFGEKDTMNKGLLNNVYKGTLLLYQVDEIPIEMQSKLLDFLLRLQKKGKEQKGDNHQVRIIATAHPNLQKKVEQELFRKDLFYFLNVIPIQMPSLKERKDDIIPLAMLFTKYFNNVYSMNKKLSHDLIDHLTEYSWPGNVRELRNLVERLIVTSPTEIIIKEHLPKHMQHLQKSSEVIQITEIVPMKVALEEIEKKLLEMALEKFETTTQIADALKVNQSTISRKINKYLLNKI